jgi:hypothetical protein
MHDTSVTRSNPHSQEARYIGTALVLASRKYIG